MREEIVANSNVPKRNAPENTVPENTAPKRRSNRGRKKTGRTVAMTPKLAESCRPAYRFVTPGVILRSKSIPVYLDEDDPEIRGKVENYGFDPRTFDRALFRMYKEERKKAWTMFYFMKTKPGFCQKEADSLQERSRELFVAMQALEAELMEANGEEHVVLQGEMRIRELKERQTDEYEAYVNGQITAEDFRESKQKIRAEIGALEAEAADGKARQKEQSEDQIKSRWFLEKSKGKLNREMAEALIDTVLVGDGIEVRWKE